MWTHLKRLGAISALTLTAFGALPTPVTAYPVDCAILLCLAGGWPASAPCAQARAVFIARITPWPIEPPLQIWNCPLGIASATLPTHPAQREIAALHVPVPIRPNEPFADLHLAQAEGMASAALPDDIRRVIQSIRVFHIRFNQRESMYGGCNRSDTTRLGTYGADGTFVWADSAVTDVPAASAFRPSDGCSRVSYRSVFIAWQDQAGRPGFEEVTY
jgi:hypothetical protein